MAGDDVRFHRGIAALYDPVQSHIEHAQAPAHRGTLAEGLSGRVLEIGLGSGAMFPYYDTHAECRLLADSGVRPGRRSTGAVVM